MSNAGCGLILYKDHEIQCVNKMFYLLAQLLHNIHQWLIHLFMSAPSGRAT